MQHTISNLPPLPRIVFDFMDEYTKNDSNGALSSVIENAGLTKQILSIVNTTLYDLPTINSLEKAVSVIGREILFGIVLCLGVQRALKTNLGVYGTSNEMFFKTMIFQNEAAHLWCDNKYVKYKKNITLLSLISEVGKFGIAKHISNKNIDPIALQKANSFATLRQSEKELLGTTSEAVTVAMLQEWGFPKQPLHILEKFCTHSQPSDNDDIKQTHILHVIKTLYNIKEHHTPNAVHEAILAAKHYELHDFENVVRLSE
jgi:HD-like signal output (HDOD) protein